MVLAAFRRLAVLVLSAMGVTAAISLLIGALIGASIDRSLVLGFYLGGCLLMVAGFFVGNRGPSRVKSESAGPINPLAMFGSRRLRWSTLGEQDEAISSSAVFVVLGVVLVIVGVLLDTRHSAF